MAENFLMDESPRNISTSLGNEGVDLTKQNPKMKINKQTHKSILWHSKVNENTDSSYRKGGIIDNEILIVYDCVEWRNIAGNKRNNRSSSQTTQKYGKENGEALMSYSYLVVRKIQSSGQKILRTQREQATCHEYKLLQCTICNDPKGTYKQQHDL